MKDELVVLSYPGPDRSVRLDQLRAGRAMPRRYRNRRIGEFLKELEVEMTIPDKPRSGQQKYRLAAKGRGWLAKHGKRGGAA